MKSTDLANECFTCNPFALRLPNCNTMSAKTSIILYFENDRTNTFSQFPVKHLTFEHLTLGKSRKWVIPICPLTLAWRNSFSGRKCITESSTYLQPVFSLKVTSRCSSNRRIIASGRKREGVKREKKSAKRRQEYTERQAKTRWHVKRGSNGLSGSALSPVNGEKDVFD